MRIAGLVVTAAAAVVLLAAPGAGTGTFSTGPLVQVSGTSPFAGCTADNVAAQPGTVFIHSEVEPWIDVDPTDTDTMVGIWQQDRWSNGGARGLVAAASADGGASWTSVVIPGLTKCLGGPYDRATDPWVTFSPNGDVHQLALVFNAADFDHALLASKSTDGGLTWSAPRAVIRDLDGNVFNDKQTITADPHDADFVYAVWDRLVFPVERAADRAFVAFGGRGPTWFARTTDGGATWEPARKIFDAGQESQTIGNQIVVLPDGDLLNVMDLIYYFRNNKGIRGLNVAVIRSEDRGVTWSQRATILDKLGTIEIHDPETGDPVRTGDIIPDAAVAPNGDAYVVWQDARPNGGSADAIVVSKSTDGGFTWTPFAKVNKTPTGIPIRNQQAFTPSVHVSADGTVAVTYYDFRNNDSGSDLKTDYFVVHCHPTTPASCTNAADWGGEERLTTTSFDMRRAPLARGFFTGDYEGLASAGSLFTAFFSQPHGADPSSAFFRAVGP